MQKIFFKLYPTRKNFLSYPYVIKCIVATWRPEDQEKIVTRAVSATTQSRYEAMARATMAACDLSKCIKMAASSECDKYFNPIPLKRKATTTTTTTTAKMPSSSASRKRSRESTPKEAPGLDLIPLALSVPPESGAYTSGPSKAGRGNGTYLNIKDKVYLLDVERAPTLFPKTYDPNRSVDELRKACENNTDKIDVSFVMPDGEDLAHTLSAWHMFTSNVAKADMPPSAKLEIKEWVSDQGYAKARLKDLKVLKGLTAAIKKDHGIDVDSYWNLPYGKYRLALHANMIWKMPGKAGLQWIVSGIKLLEPFERQADLIDDTDYIMSLL